MRACAGCRVAHKAFAGVRGLPCLAHKDVSGLADVGWAVRSRPTCIMTWAQRSSECDPVQLHAECVGNLAQQNSGHVEIKPHVMVYLIPQMQMKIYAPRQ